MLWGIPYAGLASVAGTPVQYGVQPHVMVGVFPEIDLPFKFAFDILGNIFSLVRKYSKIKSSHILSIKYSKLLFILVFPIFGAH